jgi:hypothetical protein
MAIDWPVIGAYELQCGDRSSDLRRPRASYRPKIIKNRSERNQARSIMRKELGEKAIAGKDIDHKKMVNDGGTNACKNLRVRSKHAKRGWNRKKR